MDLEKAADGNLHIHLNRTGRRHFADIREQRDAFGINAALYALLEDHLCTGWEMVPPEDIGASDGRADPLRRDRPGRRGAGDRGRARLLVPDYQSATKSRNSAPICAHLPRCCMTPDHDHPAESIVISREEQLACCLRRLLDSTELNMDDMEEETRDAIREALPFSIPLLQMEPDRLADAIEALATAIEGNTQEMKALRDAIDDLRTEYVHAIRNAECPYLAEAKDGQAHLPSFPLDDALEMDLTPEQIRQAIAEGVTTAVGLRRIEKNTRADEVPETIACAHV